MPLRSGQGRLVMAVACVPFVTSLFFTSAPEAAPVSGDRPHSGLVFDQYLVNFGNRPVAPRPVISVPFRYRNVSDTEIKIHSLTPSCGCLQPTIDSMVIAPGEVGELTMPVRTANEKAGPHEYLVKVLYEDTAQREVDLALKVVLPQKQVVIEPRAMWFYHSGMTATTQAVTVTDYRMKSFRVARMYCTSDLWTVRESADTWDADGHRRLKLEITLRSDVPAGRHRGIVVIETDDPRFPRLQIPVGCQGLAKDQGLTLLAEPDTLVLQPTPAGAVHGSTIVRNTDGGPARVVGVDVSPEFIKAKVTKNEANETVITLSGQQDAGGTPVTRAVLSVRTEGGTAPLTIPVVIRPAVKKQ